MILNIYVYQCSPCPMKCQAPHSGLVPSKPPYPVDEAPRHRTHTDRAVERPGRKANTNYHLFLSSFLRLPVYWRRRYIRVAVDDIYCCLSSRCGPIVLEQSGSSATVGLEWYCQGCLHSVGFERKAAITICLLPLAPLAVSGFIEECSAAPRLQLEVQTD